MEDTANQKPASIGQLLEIVNTFEGSIAKLLIERNLSFNQAKKLIEKVGKTALQDISANVVEKIFKLVPPDPVNSYKKDLEDFFNMIYGIKINLSDKTFPEVEDFNHFMVFPQGFTAGYIYSRFVKIDLQFTKYMHQTIELSKIKEQSRPEAYIFAHRGGIESDKMHAGKSYSDFIVEDTRYMTISEYMLCCQFMWWRHNILLDQKGCTITSTRAKDNVVMHGYCRKNMFKLGCTYFTKGTLGDGPREIRLI